jgi:hypothetical protein
MRARKVSKICGATCRDRSRCPGTRRSCTAIAALCADGKFARRDASKAHPIR